MMIFCEMLREYYTTKPCALLIYEDIFNLSMYTIRLGKSSSISFVFLFVYKMGGLVLMIDRTNEQGDLQFKFFFRE